MSGTYAGLEWKIIPGEKAPNDLVLVVRVSDWTYVPMAWGALFADFHYQVEDILYPHGKGGKKYLEHVRRAASYGWEYATRFLDSEKRTRGIEQQLFTHERAASLPSPENAILGFDDEVAA